LFIFQRNVSKKTVADVPLSDYRYNLTSAGGQRFYVMQRSYLAVHTSASR